MCLRIRYYTNSCVHCYGYIIFWGKDIKKNTDECVRVVEETIFDLKIRNDEFEYMKEK